VQNSVKLPEFPDFRNLKLNDKAFLDPLFRDLQPEISELTFTNLFAWNDSEPVRLSQLGETVLIQRKRIRDGKTILFPPIGKEPFSRMLDTVKESLKKHHPNMPLYGITVEQAKQIDRQEFRLEQDREDWDYVYLTSDLADLPGDKYHSKRNFIARCLAQHKCEYKSVDSQVIDDCLKLQTDWCNLRSCNEVPGLEAENNAIKTALDNHGHLGVTGGAIYVNGKLEAFTLAERLNSETAVVHFEKANPKIEGLYQLINQWFCQKALKSYKFVNREQDLGVEGLRKAKLSYHPHHMVEKYLAYLKQGL
jgi:hypothetical protein